MVTWQHWREHLCDFLWVAHCQVFGFDIKGIDLQKKNISEELLSVLDVLAKWKFITNTI